MDRQLYRDHVSELQRRSEAALAATGFDGLVIHSGAAMRYHADDQDAPFHTTPHFARWTPLDGPGHLLLVRPGEKPRLVRFAPEDYWYEQAPLGSPYWADSFELTEVGEASQVYGELPRGHFAFVADAGTCAGPHGFDAAQINPVELLHRMDWDSSFKTAYEVACIEAATRKGVRAHDAARAAFEAGGSELRIHQAYMQALATTEDQLPYGNIVALDAKGAILHYLGKRDEGGGHVLLIDCGARHQGYACDITRTWTRDSCDDTFRHMVAGMDAMQQELCAAVRPGVPYPEIHHRAHLGVGAILQEAGVLKVGAEEAVQQGLTRPFFPHGVGHFLGVQVHDVSGHQAAPAGGVKDPPELHPYLRTTRDIAPGQVFTIEPGLYFIEMLLRPHRQGPHAASFDWDLVDRLSPCGGIRIEDNLAVTADGARNITREVWQATN